MSASSKKVDFTEGPIFFKVFRFAAPIMLSGILQNAYHIADKVVVGSFSGDDLALAAVGSSGAITTFIVNLLISLSGGCGVVIPPQNENELYGAMKDIMINPEKRSQMGKKGKEKAMSLYQTDIVFEQYAHLWNN